MPIFASNVAFLMRGLREPIEHGLIDPPAPVFLNVIDHRFLVRTRRMEKSHVWEQADAMARDSGGRFKERVAVVENRIYPGDRAKVGRVIRAASPLKIVSRPSLGKPFGPSEPISVSNAGFHGNKLCDGPRAGAIERRAASFVGFRYDALGNRKPLLGVRCDG